MALPVMPSTHAWFRGGPGLKRVGNTPQGGGPAIFASASDEVWVWDEDTDTRVTDLLDENANPITAPVIDGGWIAGVGIPVATVIASFSIGQFGKRYELVSVQTLKNAQASTAPTDAQVQNLVNDSGSATRGALDGTYAPVSVETTKQDTTPAAELILYVSPRGSDSNNGLQWSTAKATIKGALAAIGSTMYARIEVGTGTITETVAWGTVPRGTVINGSGKFATVVKHQFNGDLATLAQEVQINNLTIDGQGATYTGRCFNFTGSDGAQAINRCKIYNFDGECLWFAYTAGSGFTSTQCDMWRVSAGSGTGRYSVVIENVQQLSAVPRSWSQFASGGQCSFDFGASNDTFVDQSFLNDLNYTTESRGVHITGSRLASPRAVQDLNGSNNTIVGCDVFSAVTIAAGSGGNCVGPNAYQNIPVDNSGLTSNKIIHESKTYTPTLTSSGTAPALGNGTMSGSYSRQGSTMLVRIQLVVGSTTTLGTGELRFGLPYTRADGSVSVCGQALILIGSTYYTAMVQSIGAVGYVRLVRDAGLVSSSSPGTLAAGDTIRILANYPQ